MSYDNYSTKITSDYAWGDRQTKGSSIASDATDDVSVFANSSSKSDNLKFVKYDEGFGSTGKATEDEKPSKGIWGSVKSFFKKVKAKFTGEDKTSVNPDKITMENDNLKIMADAKMKQAKAEFAKMNASKSRFEANKAKAEVAFNERLHSAKSDEEVQNLIKTRQIFDAKYSEFKPDKNATDVENDNVKAQATAKYKQAMAAKAQMEATLNTKLQSAATEEEKQKFLDMQQKLESKFTSLSENYAQMNANSLVAEVNSQQ